MVPAPLTAEDSSAATGLGNEGRRGGVPAWFYFNRNQSSLKVESDSKYEKHFLEAIEMIKQGTSLLLSKGLFFTILLQLESTPVMGRDKTDVVILKNGDHVTGEIKSLERGKMSLSTDSMGTLSIEWEDVAQVTSQWVFEVETEMGLRTVGSLSPATEPEMTCPHERVHLLS